jgi:hypothetical protein
MTHEWEIENGNRFRISKDGLDLNDRRVDLRAWAGTVAAEFVRLLPLMMTPEQMAAIGEKYEADYATAEAAGFARAAGQIADWLERQADKKDAGGGDWVRRAVADVEAATLREAAEAVRQGRARQEGGA